MTGNCDWSFNPHRPPEADAARVLRTGRPPLIELFQPSPAPRGRCCASLSARPKHQRKVSTLTGPQRPMLLHIHSFAEGSQSFNPHRPPEADAASRYVKYILHESVSTLTGPQRPMLLPALWWQSGRLFIPPSARIILCSPVFNPHPVCGTNTPPRKAEITLMLHWLLRPMQHTSSF